MPPAASLAYRANHRASTLEEVTFALSAGKEKRAAQPREEEHLAEEDPGLPDLEVVLPLSVTHTSAILPIGPASCWRLFLSAQRPKNWRKLPGRSAVGSKRM